MHRYFSYSDNNKYIDVLKDMVDSYNKSYHRSIKCTPISITNETDQNKIFYNLYKYRREDGDKSEIKVKFKVGDKVRISKIKKHSKKAIHRIL